METSWSPGAEPAVEWAGGVRVWVLRVPGPAGLARLDLSVLDDAERQRFAAARRWEDRAGYGLGHVALRQILGGQLGVRPEAVGFARDDCPCCGGPHGRPVLADRAAGLEFSLSHGGDLVLVGTAPTAIGVDVERVATEAAALEVTGELHPAERERVTQAQESDRAAEFTRIWVRKEAYLKGLGTGLGRPLDLDDLTGGVPGWDVAGLPVDPGHAAAVAVRHAEFRD